MPEETQIVALYLGSSAETLPRLRVGSCFVDLNRAPFVVQRKGDLLYQTLLTLSPEKFDAMIEDFLSLIARRMAKNIYDDDKHVEGNFGVVEGRLIQIDPGRFFFDERPPRPPEIEWERATRELYAWLKTQDKERLTAFEKAMEKHCPGIYK